MNLYQGRIVPKVGHGPLDHWIRSSRLPKDLVVFYYKCETMVWPPSSLAKQCKGDVSPQSKCANRSIGVTLQPPLIWARHGRAAALECMYSTAVTIHQSSWANSALVSINDLEKIMFGLLSCTLCPILNVWDQLRIHLSCVNNLKLSIKRKSKRSYILPTSSGVDWYFMVCN